MLYFYPILDFYQIHYMRKIAQVKILLRCFYVKSKISCLHLQQTEESYF